ncbi:MAG: patatin-like phospholipase family protein [Planctomycetales bacterium]
MSESFATVLAAELQQIRDRRAVVQAEKREPVAAAAAPGDAPELRAVQVEALRENLFGLAFSGGGIRSATFNLGVLQRLAKNGLVKHVDYLSTVSGGGFIGSWLMAWIAREGQVQEQLGVVPMPQVRRSVENVERQLPTSRKIQAQAHRDGLPPGYTFDCEPEPVHHLRAYSNYLTPKLGFFSADSWTLVAIYLRNLLLNQLNLLAIAILLIVATRYVVLGFCDAAPVNPLAATLVAVMSFLSMVLAIFVVAREMNRLDEAQPSGGNLQRINSEMKLHFRVLLPLLIAAVTVTWLLTSPTMSLAPANPVNGASPDGLRLRVGTVIPWLQLGQPDAWKTAVNKNIPWSYARKPVLLLCLLHGSISLLAFVRRDAVPQSGPIPNRAVGRWDRSLKFVAAFAAGAVEGLLLFLVLAKILWPVMGDGLHALVDSAPGIESAPAAIVTLGPPLMLLVFIAGSFIEVGLLGTALNGTGREWWSRVCAWSLIYAVLWAGVFGITLFGLKGMEYLGSQHWTWSFSGATLTWLATSIAGALAGNSGSTKDGRGNRFVEIVGTVAPYVFIVGLAVFVSWIVSNIVGPGTAVGPGTIPWGDFNSPEPWWLVGLFGVAAALALLLMWRIDANIFSLNASYGNRLVRCYLGASRKKPHCDDCRHSDPYRGGAPTNSKEPYRNVNPVTGLDPNDDFPLRELQIGAANQRSRRKLPIYWGPFPIVNTALNLVSGDELAWQERQAESFVLTPLYCGSRSTGFQKLEERPEADLLTLGKAVAISGAAASPNMGYHSSPALGALMTVFNVRLGWWMRNPNYVGRQPWAAQSPGMGTFLIRELLGQTNEKGREIYLSDGGHFDNLGVYELVRRRCRFIIACDAGADPNCNFEDLGNLIRKCRNDFGIRIELDVAPIRPSGPDNLSRWHCAVGRIRYSDVHPRDGQPADKPLEDGILVYIKPSLTGDEPPDILNYHRANREFPQEPTSDQFYGESQFESYRALGDHIMAEVLGEPHQRLVETSRLALPTDTAEQVNAKKVRPAKALKKLFDRLKEEWQPAVCQLEENLANSSEGYVALHEILRKESTLERIGMQLYANVLKKAKDDKEPTKSNEVHFICQLLQVMETAWLEMRLDDHPTHALKRGWIRLMKRWASSEIVQEHWKLLKPEFSAGFGRFFERLDRLDVDDGDS